MCVGMYGPGGMGPGPRGMMIPRPGVPMMGMGRGGFPPMAGPPMDMYYYNPYMGEGMGFYGKYVVLCTRYMYLSHKCTCRYIYIDIHVHVPLVPMYL